MIERNKSAFPIPSCAEGIGSNWLTKKEYFTAMAMQALVSTLCKDSDFNESVQESIAYNAVSIADIVLNKLSYHNE